MPVALASEHKVCRCGCGAEISRYEDNRYEGYTKSCYMREECPEEVNEDELEEGLEDEAEIMRMSDIYANW